ncbi:MAG: DUF4179 domain-containing protein [Eubacteriales bacterium]|nr:DUF4179 domain-containing protein [Eubacteriales bacterium]
MHKKQHFFFKACVGFAAAAAVFSGVCIVNPTFAAQIPLLGHVFEKLGESLRFSGDFQKYAKVENINSQTANGMTVTLSEVYCNDAALYVSLVIESEDTFPETMNFQDSDTPLINLYDSTLKFSYSEREEQLFGVANALDGKMVDEHTYTGVLRYDLSYSNIFMKEETIEIPEQFTVEFHIPQISGLKPDGKLPEMPEDLRAEYEQAMRDNGLGLTDEDYANFTEEQKEIEHQLFTKMNNAYDERYPDTWEQPNQENQQVACTSGEIALDVESLPCANGCSEAPNPTLPFGSVPLTRKAVHIQLNKQKVILDFVTSPAFPLR